MCKSRWRKSLWSQKISSIISLIILAPLLLGISGCPNLYSELADKKTDRALLYEAQQLVNRGEYSAAIEAMQSASAAAKDKRDGRLVLASAYAGLCGLDLISLAGDLADLGSTQLFIALLSSFRQATVLDGQANDCITAEGLLQGIDTAEMRADDHVFLAFVALAKIGSHLGQSAANDGGSVAAGFDACSSTDLSENSVRQIGTGITVMLSSFINSGTTVLDGLSSTITPICTQIDTLTGTTGFCSRTDPTEFSANEVLALRALIKSNEIGLNTCGGSIGTGTCFCL